MMAVWLGDKIPDDWPDINTTEGSINLCEYWRDRWGMLFSVPTGFSPVSTMELGTLASLIPEFTKRNVKCIALCYAECSVDLDEWIKDILVYNKLSTLGYPIIADPINLTIDLGIQDLDQNFDCGRAPAGRSVLIVGPDRRLKANLTYPGTTGRNFDEILRLIDSLQLCADKKVETPPNWKIGDECMIPATVSEENAGMKFPQYALKQVPSGKKYMRIIPQAQR